MMKRDFRFRILDFGLRVSGGAQSKTHVVSKDDGRPLLNPKSKIQNLKSCGGCLWR